MDLTAWTLYTLLAVAAVVGSVLHYRIREPPGPARTALGVLRGLAAAILVLVLFDPVLPGRHGDVPTLALVDASASMGLAGSDGPTAWEEAVAVVDSLAAARVRRFADGLSAASTEGTWSDAPPRGARSLLAPALRSAVEATGAGRVVVITDGALEDAAGAARVARESGVPVDVRLVGRDRAWNVGVMEVTAPGWAEAGERVVVRAGVAAVGRGAPDSVLVRLLRGERELDRTRVPVPAAGAVSTALLAFTPGPADRPVRLDVEVSPGGSAEADDGRSLYARVAEAPAGVVLVSFRPDQEPRFLLPVLGAALGVPQRGWLGLPGGRFVQIGSAGEAGERATLPAVRAALEDATLVVLHGYPGDAPAWASAALRRGPVLVFPADSMSVGPLAVGAARPGDWYPHAVVPSSPVAGLLAVLETDVPPLGTLRSVDAPASFWAPLRARAGRRGEPEPVLVAGEVDGRRLAVALGEGYWRWAFAGAEGRSLYDRFWSAVAGWLADDPAGTGSLRPAALALASDESIEWIVPVGADSVRVRLEPARAGADRASAGVDTTVAVVGGRARVARQAPGHYRYRVELAGSGTDTAAGDPAEGELTVEADSRELTRAPVQLATGRAVGAAAGEVARRAGPGRPLHATPWPYVAVVALLAAEWVLRRRFGLR